MFFHQLVDDGADIPDHHSRLQAERFAVENQMRNLPKGMLYAVTAVLAMSLASAAMAQNWPQTYFNPAHTGYNKKETTLSPSNIANLQLVWGNSTLGTAVDGFALNNGVIYAQSFATSDNLAAIDATTGATLWTVTTRNVGFSYNDPVATGGRLVFAQCSFVDTISHDYGAVCAYKQSTGKLVWQWSNPCNCQPEAGLTSPLVYANGVVYFGYGNGGIGGAEYMVAADAKNGATLWTYGFGSSNSAGYAAVAVDNGLVYVACNGQNGFQGVCALNQSDGSLVWSTNIGSNSLGFTVGKNLLYVNAHYIYELFALDAATGAPVWTFATDGTNYPAALAKGVLYARGSNNEINAVNATTGAAIWATTSQGISASPSAANGVIYAAQSGNNVPAASAFDARDGSLLWSAPGAGYGSVQSFVANGTLYIANGSCGQICAYGLPAGKSHR